MFSFHIAIWPQVIFDYYEVHSSRVHSRYANAYNCLDQNGGDDETLKSLPSLMDSHGSEG